MTLSSLQPIHIPSWTTKLKFPLYLSHIHAGFPSPAQDYIEDELDLVKLLIKNRPATFKMRVEGHTLKHLGIFDGDILLIDRSLRPVHNGLVVAVLEGEFVVRRFIKKGSKCFLLDNTPTLHPQEISIETDLQIWGVVTYNIHKCNI